MSATDCNVFNRASIPWRIISQRTVAASSGFILFIQAIVGVLIYYLPFYFQAVRGTNAQDSGVRNLPFLVTLLFAPMVSGALISYFGPYVPFMWFGAVFATIGSSLLFTLTPHTRHQAVNAYQIIAGLGLGSCNQIPFSATQYKLPEEKLIMGSTMVSFCVSLGPVLGTNMAQAIFAGLLVEQLEGLPGVDAVSVIRAGPTAIDQKVPSESRIAVRQVFNYALTRAFIPLIVYGSLAICCSLAMEWGNVRKQRNQGSE
ncbi:MAG: hypothetical protein LQ351_005092 [Letrouitia transgressa]|nr:MAG: hypothetical protein LQ351_005092 [Letrouitia transgressa]